MSADRRRTIQVRSSASGRRPRAHPRQAGWRFRWNHRAAGRAADRRFGAPENFVGRVDRDARQGADFDPLRAGGLRLPGLPGPVYDRYRMLRPAVSGAFEHRTGRHARGLTALGTGACAAIEREEATAKARNVSHRRYLPFSAPTAMRRAGDGKRDRGFAGALPVWPLMRGAGAIPGAARAAVARLRARTGIARPPRRLRPGLEHGVEAHQLHHVDGGRLLGRGHLCPPGGAEFLTGT